MSESQLPLIVHWESVVHDVLGRTAKFPKHVRFTLSGRIDNFVLDIYEALVEARFTRDKAPILRRANLLLEKLRLLLRICRDERHLDRKGFEHVARQLE